MSAAATRELFAAAKNGDTAKLREALAAGATVTTRDGNGWIALHEACRWGRLDACEALLAAGSDPNAAHRQLGYTPLILATFTAGNAALVRALLAAGAAPSLAAKAFGPLANAAVQGDLEAAELLLAAGADPAPLADEQRVKIGDLVARHAAIPKQTAEAAAQVAARTRAPDAEPPFVEAKPLDPAKLAIVGERARVADADLDRRGAWPTGYADLMRSHGPGTIAVKVRVYGPRAIEREQAAWRARIAQHWFWGDDPRLTRADAQHAVRIADTLDGDELVFHPRAVDTLLVLPRESEELAVASHAGLLPALARLLGRPRKLVLEPLPD
jgi:hypothetical protein